MSRLYLDPPYQRHGIGGRLVDYMFMTFPEAEFIDVYPGGGSDAFWLRQGVESIDKEGMMRITRNSRDARANPTRSFDGITCKPPVPEQREQAILVSREYRDSTGRAIGHGQEAEQAFKRWFDRSSAVDTDGRPLVVYHGTDTAFTQFKVGYDDVICFSDNPKIASEYGEGNSRKSFDECFPHVLPCYLKILNPKVITEPELSVIMDDDGERDWSCLDWIAAEAKAQNYDGLHLKGIVDFARNGDGKSIEIVQDQWLVFDPKQIKSALSNSGAYDPNSSCITDGAAYDSRQAQSNRTTHAAHLAIETIDRAEESRKAISAPRMY